MRAGIAAGSHTIRFRIWVRLSCGRSGARIPAVAGPIRSAAGLRAWMAEKHDDERKRRDHPVSELGNPTDPGRPVEPKLPERRHAKRRHRVEGELAMQERDRGQRAQQQRAPPHDPEHARPTETVPGCRPAPQSGAPTTRPARARMAGRPWQRPPGVRRASRISSRQRSSAAATLNSTIVRCSANTVGPSTRNTAPWPTLRRRACTPARRRRAGARGPPSGAWP